MLELSGAQWCARFPGSKSTKDLLPAFAKGVVAYIAAIESGGGHVSIGATYRPAERAYLMHYACMIADGGQDHTAVPAMAGVNIRWDHPTLADSKAAARAMKAGYGIQFPAALVSRHTQRRAIDMKVTWENLLHVIDANGVPNVIEQGNHQRLWAVSKTFGVIALVTDPAQHYSDDGH